MFNANSPLVKTWVRLLTGEKPVYTISDVPNIGNLKQVVKEEVKKNQKIGGKDYEIYKKQRVS